MHVCVIMHTCIPHVCVHVYVCAYQPHQFPIKTVNQEIRISLSWPTVNCVRSMYDSHGVSSEGKMLMLENAFPDVNHLVLATLEGTVAIHKEGLDFPFSTVREIEEALPSLYKS